MGITRFVDGFTSGAILFCISSGVSVLSKFIDKMDCFVAGTLILTEYGYKAIEDIELGDKVWSWCEETGEKVLNKVTTLFRNETKDLVHLSIAGEEITTTKGHPFYVVDYGWKKVSELVKNDKVILYDDEVVMIDNISHQHLNESISIYNFEVENTHTYYV